MKKLLKLINKQLLAEFPNANSKIKYITDYANGNYYGIIILSYQILDTKYEVYICRVVSTHSMKEVKQLVKTIFINGLLFNTGNLNIVELVSGREIPLKENLVRHKL